MSYVDNTFITEDETSYYIQAPYGCGKTELVIKLIVDNSDKYENVLIISARQSLTRDLNHKISMKYREKTKELKKKIGRSYRKEMTTKNNIASYMHMNKTRQFENRKRILISPHSITNIAPFVTYDIVWIDEIYSVMVEIGKREIIPPLNFDSISWIMKHCKMLIMTDNNWSNEMHTTLETIRCNKIKHVKFDKDINIDKYVIKEYEQKRIDTVIQQINDDLKQDKRICLACDNRKILMEVLHKLDIKDDEYLVYTGIAKDSKTLNNINLYWSAKKLIAYTPTISFGCSFDAVEHFHRCYGIFTYSSVSSRVFCQMIHRVRHLIDDEIVIFESLTKNKYLGGFLKRISKEYTVNGKGEIVAKCDTLNVLTNIAINELNETKYNFKNSVVKYIKNN